MNLRDHPGVMYLNCESGKRLPFKNDFKSYTITDPHQVLEGITAAEGKAHVHTVVIDSLTYLMDMYESKYVLGTANTMKGWSDFAQYFKELMQQRVASSTKKIIFTAHTLDSYNENEMTVDTKVPVKGSLKNNGINLGVAA